jgi:hypothetical protein
MNNTPHLQIPGQADAPSGDLLANLGKQINLDPEALKLLEQTSIDNGVDFGQVLEATKSGSDPEAVIELLKSEKELGTKAGNEIIQNTTSSDADKLAKALQKNMPNSESGKASQELNQILGKTVKQPEQVLNQQTALNQQTVLAQDTVEVTPKEVVSSKEILPNKMSDVKTLDSNAKHHNQLSEIKLPQTQKSALTSEKAVVDSSLVKEEVALNSKLEKNQLVRFDQFMSKQSPTMRMNSAKKAYNPMNESMFAKKVDASLPGVTTIKKEQTKLQDIMFSQPESEAVLEGSQGENLQAIVKNSNKMNNPSVNKVFDINTLSKLDTTNDVIAKVQDYILQSKVGNTPEAELSFKHHELGKIDLLVQKEHGDTIRLTIGTNSKEGLKFFTQHQRDLISSLNSAGIQVSDFKLDSASLSSGGQNSSNDGSNKESLARGNGNQQHNSQNGQRDQESRKRSQLWEQFNKEAA